MNRFELLNLLESLKFDSNEYWLITGAAMVFYGFRKETGDLDLGYKLRRCILQTISGGIRNEAKESERL